MRPHPDHAPKKPAVPKLRRVRLLHLKGSGEVVLHLNGTGRVKVHRGRGDDFEFEGRGLPRHLSSEVILLDRATGTVSVRGLTLEVEFDGGNAEIQVNGTFEGDETDPPSREDLPHGPRAATRGDYLGSEGE